MKLNKIIAALASMLMLLTFTVSCESGDNGSGGTNTGTSSQDTQNNGTDTQSPDPNTTNTSTFKIVSTTFPQYDWIREIIGDKAGNFELTLLADSAVDLHSYVPSISDIAKISDCDMFIFTGGESDEWAEDILESAGNSDIIVINLVEELGDNAKIEELVEGMEHDDHDDHDDDDHDHDNEIDEHVWLSLRNVQLFCEVIAEQISVLDPDNADVYESNMTAYNQKLAALDAEYKDMVQSAETHTLLFADRFPFRYFVDDYGLDYFAAFSGCSAETEASFNTINTLVKKLDELELDFVMVTESSDKKIAETIIANSKSKNQEIFVLNAVQSVTAGDIQSGTTYISIMQSNLEVLKQALGSH